jgi:cell wall-associated NlpC family hydrolase
MAVATPAQVRYLKRKAKSMGLDVSVLMANFAHEGLSGGIGDGGHAFGPGQMNDAGGVLTGKLGGMSAQQKNEWAWSKKGINYLLSGIKSKVGNKRGEAAMRSLIYDYERPADKDGAFRTRMDTWKSGKYGQTLGGGPGITPMGRGKKQVTQFDQDLFRKQAAQMFIEASNAAVQGDFRPQMDIGQRLEEARKAATTRVKVAQGGPNKGGVVLGNSPGSALLKAASKQIGQQYVWGGESRAEGGFDCSGLIQWAAASLGIQIPRTAAEQGRAGMAVNYKNMKPGDILVAKDGHHVVMYAGGGKVIAAPHTGTTVQYQDLSSFPPSTYFARRLVGGKKKKK